MFIIEGAATLVVSATCPFKIKPFFMYINNCLSLLIIAKDYIR